MLNVFVFVFSVQFCFPNVPSFRKQQASREIYTELTYGLDIRFYFFCFLFISSFVLLDYIYIYNSKMRRRCKLLPQAVSCCTFAS